MWYKLKLNKCYTRHPCSLYRFLKKIGFYQKLNINNTSKYIPKKYDTPKNIGQNYKTPKEIRKQLFELNLFVGTKL